MGEAGVLIAACRRLIMRAFTEGAASDLGSKDVAP
jgi:hypothetical protein